MGYQSGTTKNPELSHPGYNWYVGWFIESSCRGEGYQIGEEAT